MKVRYVILTLFCLFNLVHAGDVHLFHDQYASALQQTDSKKRFYALGAIIKVASAGKPTAEKQAIIDNCRAAQKATGYKPWRKWLIGGGVLATAIAAAFVVYRMKKMPAPTQPALVHPVPGPHIPLQQVQPVGPIIPGAPVQPFKAPSDADSTYVPEEINIDAAVIVASVLNRELTTAGSAYMPNALKDAFRVSDFYVVPVLPDGYVVEENNHECSICDKQDCVFYYRTQCCDQIYCENDLRTMLSNVRADSGLCFYCRAPYQIDALFGSVEEQGKFLRRYIDSADQCIKDLSAIKLTGSIVDFIHSMVPLFGPTKVAQVSPEWIINVLLVYKRNYGHRDFFKKLPFEAGVKKAEAIRNFLSLICADENFLPEQREYFRNCLYQTKDLEKDAWRRVNFLCRMYLVGGSTAKFEPVVSDTPLDWGIWNYTFNGRQLNRNPTHLINGALQINSANFGQIQQALEAQLKMFENCS